MKKALSFTVSLASSVFVGVTSGVLIAIAIQKPLDKLIDKYVDAAYDRVWGESNRVVAPQEIVTQAVWEGSLLPMVIAHKEVS